MLAAERWQTYRYIISYLFSRSLAADSMWTLYGSTFDKGFRDVVENIRLQPFKER